MKDSIKIFLLTMFAMIAFAGNSLLCRWALKDTMIDAVSFTTVRMISGALMLWVIFRLRNIIKTVHITTAGNWPSALALFTYATAFSCAYSNLSTGTGALLLFAAVQITMMVYGFCKGERLYFQQILGLFIAIAGVVWLLVPNISTPNPSDSLLMLTAGIAWAIYSLRGKKEKDAIAVTTGNFMFATIFSIGLSLILISTIKINPIGIMLATISGAITSGIGYVIWYAALQKLNITSAAVVQLTVPIIAAIGGGVFLNDVISLRLIEASVATLSGIGLVLISKTELAKE